MPICKTNVFQGLLPSQNRKKDPDNKITNKFIRQFELFKLVKVNLDLRREISLDAFKDNECKYR